MRNLFCPLIDTATDGSWLFRPHVFRDNHPLSTPQSTKWL